MVAALSGLDVETDADHQRYQTYLRAFAVASPADDRELIGFVLGDPDAALAESAVGTHVEHRAELGEGFRAWATSIADLIDGRDFLTTRVAEWSLVLDLRAGRVDRLDELVEASDWCQRTVADTATSAAVLQRLADSGRTKGVRNSARRRLPRRSTR